MIALKATKKEQAQVMDMTITPIPGATFGATVAHLELAGVTHRVKSDLREALREAHGLLCFRFHRLLSGDELHALTSVFGDSEYGPGVINGLGKQAAPGEHNRSVEEQLAEVRARGEDPFIVKFGNENPDTGKTESVDSSFYADWDWHTDMSYVEVPPTYSLLHARRVPHDGGDTGFCDQVAAAAELPAELHRRALELRIKHDATYGSDGTLRPGMTPPPSPVEAVGYPHPALRVIPETGEEALFLGRRTLGYVMGMEIADSESLLDELWAHATQQRFCYRHRWRPGEVVVWDNRRLLHRKFALDENQPRYMWRTQTKGEPVQPVLR